MNKHTYLLITVFVLFFSMSRTLAQDMGVVNIISPDNSGCDIGSEQVQVDIFNFGASTITGAFDVTYQLNNEAPVSQTDLNILGFGAGDTRTFTFIAPVDLNGKYGSNTFKVYTELNTDMNNSNDTMTITIVNDEPTNGGNLLADDTVCQSGNIGQLILEGSVGSVQEWQLDEGAGFVPLAVTDTFYNYSNLITSTSYRVQVKSGTCPAEFSNVITIQVDTPANAGSLMASKVICLGDSGDTLELTGYYGSIIKWQSDDGSGWMDIANTDDTLIYGSLTQTTMYRAIVDTGVCNPDTSNVITITVLPSSQGGNIIESDTVCATSNSGVLNLVSSIGNVIQWEFSIDQLSWVPIVNTDTFLLYNNLAQTTSYRSLVQSASCPPVYSDTAIITVDQPANAGMLNEDKVLCSGDPGDTLELVAYFGNIVKWQSDDGSGWMDIANTDDTLIYGSLMQSTMYRAIVDTGICGPDTSNIVTISVVSATMGGNLEKDDTVCANSNSDTLILENSLGDIIQWEFSEDGFSWIPIINTDTFLIYSNLTQTTRYRVLVQSGSCPSEYSDTATITVNQPADAGILEKSNTVCAGSPGDTLRLVNHFGNIIKWQSNDGSGWTDIMNTTDTLTYPAPTMDISYRVIVDTGVCGADTSNIVDIQVVSATMGGNVFEEDTVCADDNSGTLILVNHLGNIIQWESSDDDGFTWTPITNTDTFQIYNNLSGDRMYRVLVQASGCNSEYSDTVTISTVPQPIGGQVDGDRSICSGVNLDTLILENYLGTTLQWQSDDGSGWTNIVNNSDSLFVTNLNTTTSYRVIVGNGICIDDTSTVATLTVIANTFGGVLEQSDSICLGDNNGTLTLSNHVGDIRWWEISENEGVSWTPIVNEDTFQLYSNLIETTWYRVLVEGTSCPNDYSDTAILTPYIPEVSIIAQDTTTFCDGDSVQLVATSGYSEYLWNTLDTTNSIIARETGNYTVSITDFRSCVNSDSIEITVNPLPLVDAGMDTMISLGRSIQLIAQGGVSYSWSPTESLNNAQIQNPIASPKETTTYSVTGVDENGCMNMDDVLVTVLKDFDFAPKNLITPNGDGFNDTWKIDNLIEYSECTLTILNRYGAVIYQTQSYDDSWGGTTNDGSRVSDGTYYYIITCAGSDVLYKGHITVLTK